MGNHKTVDLILNLKPDEYYLKLIVSSVGQLKEGQSYKMQTLVEFNIYPFKIINREKLLADDYTDADGAVIQNRKPAHGELNVERRYVVR